MTAPADVLIVEDEARTADLVALYLRHEGFRVTVARDGTTARQHLATTPFDLMVVDRMLPGVDGIALAKFARETHDVPVIMLTAMVQESDRLDGFAAGAEDYVTKPFSPRELVARCRAVLRRVATHRERSRGGVRVGALFVDGEGGDACFGEQPLALSPTELRLLQVLMRSAGRAVSRDELAERALRGGSDIGPRTVDAHVKNLRRKLEDAGAACIDTVFGIGYRLNADGARRV